MSFKLFLSKKTVSIVTMAFAVLLSSCYVEDPEINSLAGDYFPLTDNLSRTYEVKTGCDCNCPCSEYYPKEYFSYNYSYSIKGDTTLDGKTYKKVYYERDNYVANFIRRDGTRYYRRSASVYQPDEHMFLDTSVPAGGSWIQSASPDNQFKIENIVVATNLVMTFQYKLYSNVIQIKEVTSYSDYYMGDCGQYVVYHYYVEGIGEIYSHRPYNFCTYYSGDTNVYLKSFSLNN